MDASNAATWRASGGSPYVTTRRVRAAPGTGVASTPGWRKAISANDGSSATPNPDATRCCTATKSSAKACAEAERRGATYVDPGDTPAIVAGHATVYLELFRAHPELDAVYVPVGSGTGAAGACLIRDRLAPGCRVMGVQSAAAPAAHDSWAAGTVVAAPCETRHSGLATGVGFDLPQAILREGLHDFLIVTDDEIDTAAALLAREAHTLAEGAGATGLAGLLRDAGKPARCAVVVTGGNASDDDLRAITK